METKLKNDIDKNKIEEALKELSNYMKEKLTFSKEHFEVSQIYLITYLNT